jgi:aminoglycoside 6'-N-acetyltransferase
MLRGNKVRLRPFVRSDLGVFQQWTNDEAYNSEYNDFGLKHSGSLERGFNEEGLLGSRQGLLVIVNMDDQVVGDVSYHQEHYGPNEGSRAYNIGITVAPEHRGNGYGVEAQQLLAAYLFATYPIMRVEAQTDVTNLAEQRALEKAGFTREGVLRKAQWRGGAYHDLVVYSKLRGE